MKSYKEIMWAPTFLVLALVGYLLIRYSGQAADNCPETVSAHSLSLPYSLYYLKLDEAPALWAYRDETTYQIDLEITPWSTFAISPDGERLFHIGIPQRDSIPAGEHSSQFSLFDLPLSANPAEIQEKQIEYKSAWPSYRSGVTWV